MTTDSKIPPQPSDDEKSDVTKTTADLKKAEAGGEKADATSADAAKAPRKPRATKGQGGAGTSGGGVHGIAPNANPAPGTDPVAEMQARAKAHEEVAAGRNDAMASDADINQLGEDVHFDDVSGPHGRTITISKAGADGATVTREVTVKHDAKPEEIAAAKSRLIKQFIDA